MEIQAMQTSKRTLMALLSFDMVTSTAQTMPAQTNAPTSTTATSSSSADKSMEFHKGEINLSPFGVYSDQAGKKWGLGLAGTYFITENIGVGGATYWTDTGGTFIDNLEFEGYYRVPLKRIAPYAVGSIGHQFDRSYWFETIGAGVDFRVFKRIDAFADLQW